jgi:hypothetical protein
MEEELFNKVTEFNGKMNAEYLREHLNILFADTMDFTCGRYTVATCDKEKPEIRGLMANNTEYPGHGVLIPVLEFARNLA